MSHAKLENWSSLALGVWFFLSPWFLLNTLEGDALSRMSWNAWIVGAIIAITAARALQNLKPWNEWLNLSMGFWTFFSPWFLGFYEEPMLTWNALIVGALVAAVSLISIPVAQALHYQKH